MISRIYLGHEGRSNFAVLAYDEQDERELLVNEIGYYAGHRYLPAGTYDLEINADGPWLIRVTPLAWDEAARNALEGQGDDIRGWFTPAVSRQTYHFTHQGGSNFAVFLRCDTDDDLLVNAIGNVDSEHMVVFGRASRCFWDITADGAWTITPR
ncbi:hypothetical protein EYB53_010870 [Candidatus Chloroploca sp. M-50]|uniref:Uncharacterized protein n=2 Tax=Candidatus Chloroploca mongolica TaxID=2528176 RepID=A0ABS4D9T9_9CHLR|nr:hypothetical protein [Candidatus Chloroploca mongolica]